MRSTELGLEDSRLLVPVHILASCFTAFKRLSMNGKTFGGLEVNAASILESILLTELYIVIYSFFLFQYTILDAQRLSKFSTLAKQNKRWSIWRRTNTKFPTSSKLNVLSQFKRWTDFHDSSPRGLLSVLTLLHNQTKGCFPENRQTGFVCKTKRLERH